MLADRSLQYHVVVAGGGALLLSGDVRRPTQDVDVVAFATGEQPLEVTWWLPEELQEAVADVALTLGLTRDWLNAGAVAVVGDDLPEGYQERLRTVAFGNLTVLARADLPALKTLAAFDEGAGSRHLQDTRAMQPSSAEVRAAFSWARDRRHPQDPLVAPIAAALGVSP